MNKKNILKINNIDFRQIWRILFTQMMVLNIFLICAMSIAVTIWFNVSADKKMAKITEMVHKVQSAIKGDLALLSILSDLHHGQKSVVINPFFRASLKVFTPPQIFIDSFVSSEKQSSVNIFLNDQSEFLLSKSGANKMKIIGRFHVPEIESNLKNLTGYTGFNFKKKQMQEGDIEIFKGTNFYLAIKSPSLTVLDFVFYENNIILNACVGLLAIFNIFIYLTLKIALLNLKGQINSQLQNVQRMVEHSKIKEHKHWEALSKQANLNKSLARSLDALEIELCSIGFEYRKQLQNIISHIKVVETIQDYSIVRDICTVLDRLDLRHSVDPEERENVDFASIVNQAVNIHAHLLQKMEVNLVIKLGLIKETVYCNKIIFLRMLASILYQAIMASTAKAKIFLSVINYKDYIAVVIKDFGYRVSIEEHHASPFKLTFEEVKTLAHKYFMILEVQPGKNKGTLCKMYVLKKNIPNNVVVFSAK